MAAALSLARTLQGRPRRHRSPASRAPLSLSCRRYLPEENGKERRERDGEEETGRRALLRLYAEVEKAGRGLKESLSPKRKGDAKDVLLMSLSFAVYVYISQKLVCAYCAWMSVPNKF